MTNKRKKTTKFFYCKRCNKIFSTQTYFPSKNEKLPFKAWCIFCGHYSLMAKPELVEKQRKMKLKNRKGRR